MTTGGAAVRTAYVLVVAGVATVGFATGSTATILTAVALGLPTSVPALVGFYLTYGLLAQAPGANPDTSSGSVSCTSSGECHVARTGDPAAWFHLATDTVGVVALTGAAVLNLVLLHRLTAGRHLRGSASASARTPSGR